MDAPIVVRFSRTPSGSPTAHKSLTALPKSRTKLRSMPYIYFSLIRKILPKGHRCERLTGESGREDAEIDAIGFSKAYAILLRNFKLQDPNGPVTSRYRRLQWAGLLTAFVEVWRHHPVSELATRSGNRLVGY